MSRRGHDRQTSIDEWIERDRVAAEDGRRQAAAYGRPYAEPTALEIDIDPGAPLPHLVTDRQRAVVVYHAPLPHDPSWDGTTVTVIDPADPTSRQFGWLLCERVGAVSFGPSSDEGLASHPLYAAGLRHYQAHEIHDPDLPPDQHRLILTFHDETFDCTCREWVSGGIVTDFRTALALAARAVREGVGAFADRRVRCAGTELDPTRLPSVQLFRSRGFFARAIDDAYQAGWSVIRLDASRWTTEATMHSDLSTSLQFPDYYGRNLDALTDCMREVVTGEFGFSNHALGGLVVLDNFDDFSTREPRVAHVLLEILGGAAIDALQNRWQLATFVRVDDPDFSPPPFAAQAARWNPREWLRSKRVEP